MARIRSVKPEFWLDPKLTRLSRDARMLYMALWNQSDEHERLLGDARVIKGQTFPYDDDLTPDVIDLLIDELVDARKALRYTDDGAVYLHLPNLGKHQWLEPDKVPSRLPAPPSESRANKSAPRADESALLQGAGSRVQVAGGLPPEPPLRCSRHLNSTDDRPCGPCGTARRAHEQWARQQKAQPTPSAVPSPREPRCTVDGHERYVARNCKGCAADAKAAS